MSPASNGGIEPRSAREHDEHDYDGAELRNELLAVIAQVLYEIGDDYDPRMHELWRRGFMTREPHHRAARRVLHAIKDAL